MTDTKAMSKVEQVYREADLSDELLLRVIVSQHTTCGITYGFEVAKAAYQLAKSRAAHREKAIAEVEAENARLREALAEIAETPNAGWMIARAALGGPQ